MPKNGPPPNCSEKLIYCKLTCGELRQIREYYRLITPNNPKPNFSAENYENIIEGREYFSGRKWFSFLVQKKNEEITWVAVLKSSPTILDFSNRHSFEGLKQALNIKKLSCIDKNFVFTKLQYHIFLNIFLRHNPGETLESLATKMPKFTLGQVVNLYYLWDGKACSIILDIEKIQDKKLWSWEDLKSLLKTINTQY